MTSTLNPRQPTSTNSQTKSLTHCMITLINSNIHLLDLLREYERTSLNDTMRSFAFYFDANHVYPKGAEYVLNEWRGFKYHHERQKSRQDINKTSKKTT